MRFRILVEALAAAILSLPFTIKLDGELFCSDSTFSRVQLPTHFSKWILIVGNNMKKFTGSFIFVCGWVLGGKLYNPS